MRFTIPVSNTSEWRKTSVLLALLALSWAAHWQANAQDAPKPIAGIYSCVDKNGKRHKGDRPIPECADREQDLLYPDGSRKGVHPPSLTANERAEREARERKQTEERAAITNAGLRDKNLMSRYPNEAAHQSAREAALDTVRAAIRSTEQRLRELAAERKPLQNEAEFYQGRALPPKLKQLLDSNDTAARALREASANQEAELGRVTRSYDTELERLRKLLAGSQPGTLGPLVMPQEPAAPVPSPKKAAPK